MNRHFTRADVEARCLDIHVHSDDAPDMITRVYSVDLVQDEAVTSPLWIVVYYRIYKEGTPHELRTRLTDVYVEYQLGDRLLLWPLAGKTIPPGCANIEEEDKAMSRKEVPTHKINSPVSPGL